MRIIHSDYKKGLTKLKVENVDDLWCLSHIIEDGDLLRGRTVRKIKIGDQKTKSTKKTVFLEIEVEKIDFQPSQNILRVSGQITQGHEDIPKGQYHSFNLEPQKQFTLKKEKWLNFQIKKLKESTQVKSNILMCIFDREEAILILYSANRYKILTKIKGTVPKKAVDQPIRKNFYQQLVKIIEDYNQKYEPESIILASPAFYKEDLMKKIKEEEIKKKIILATCSSVDENAIKEIIHRPETKQALKESRFAQEIKLVEEVLKEISKQGLATYGLEETKKAIITGAVEKLLISDSLIQDYREKEKFDKLDELMNQADQMKSEVHIINSQHEAGKKLESLGGIAAKLRFKIE